MFCGLSQCLCVVLTTVSPATTDEPIEMPFGVWTHAGPRNHVRVFDWAEIAQEKLTLWGAGVVICLELGADLHMAQLISLPLTVSCFSKIQIGFSFLVPDDPGSPGQKAVKRVFVCVCVCVCACVRVCVCVFLC